MQVTHVINTAEVGGGAEHLLHLVRGLAGAGFESRVLVGRDGPASARLREAGVEVAVLGPFGLGAPMRLGDRLSRQRPDLVHLHGSRAGLAGALAARRLRLRPLVYTAHAFAFRRRLPAPLRWAAARAERVTCRSADRVICLTRDDLEAAARIGIPTGNFTVVPNGIPIARFPARENRRSELGIEPGAPVIGTLARLVPQKDPVTFVRVAERVAREHPSARFLLIGDGPLRPAVEQAGRALLESGALRLTGFRPDVPELLATLDVVVFASLWEGLPLTLLEAMAAERAVVASRIPGHAEVIVEGESGLLAPAGDADRLAREVAGLIADPERRSALGRRARLAVERGYTVERMVADTVSVYRSAASSGG